MRDSEVVSLKRKLIYRILSNIAHYLLMPYFSSIYISFIFTSSGVSIAILFNALTAEFDSIIRWRREIYAEVDQTDV